MVAYNFSEIVYVPWTDLLETQRTLMQLYLLMGQTEKNKITISKTVVECLVLRRNSVAFFILEKGVSFLLSSEYFLISFNSSSLTHRST